MYIRKICYHSKQNHTHTHCHTAAFHTSPCVQPLAPAKRRVPPSIINLQCSKCSSSLYPAPVYPNVSNNSSLVIAVYSSLWPTAYPCDLCVPQSISWQQPVFLFSLYPLPCESYPAHYSEQTMFLLCASVCFHVLP